MKRPTISPKPPAPSVRAFLPEAIGRARKLRPDKPATHVAVAEDIARSVPLPPGLADIIRKEARRRDR